MVWITNITVLGSQVGFSEKMAMILSMKFTPLVYYSLRQVLTSIRLYLLTYITVCET